MDVFKPPHNRNFCYNSPVPRKWSETIFDIGGRQIVPATGPKPMVGSRVPRDRACGGGQNATAYWCFRENHYFHGRGKNTVLRRVQTTRRNLFILFRPGS